MKRSRPVSRIGVPKLKLTKKVRYRVRNWPTYNESLVKRGSLTLWISQDSVAAWKAEQAPKRGGQF